MEWVFLAGIALAGYFLYRFEKLVDRYFDIRERTHTPSGTKPPMPSELLLSAYSESEDWAVEDRLKKYNELYDEYGDWEKVTIALGN